MTTATAKTRTDRKDKKSLFGPVRVRETLIRLGPIFVKIGQHLSLRPDIIPQDYCDEFLELVDSVPPEPFETSRKMIEEDLKADPDQFFSWINPRPVGSASLAQVYQARTHDGSEVAIKVLRSGVQEQVQRTLRRTRLIGRILHRMGLEPGISIPDVIDELTRWMEQELDLRQELYNLTRMYELSQGNPKMRVPRPYPELSGDRILTAEFLRGVPFVEILRLIRAGRTKDIDVFGFDRKALAENLIESVFEQIFRYEFFHADTHPGNLIALPGGVVGFVDFGLIDTLDATFRESLMRFISAIYFREPDQIYQALTEMLTPGEQADARSFRIAFLREHRTWELESELQRDGGAATGGSPLARYMVNVLRAARRNDMQVPASILSMYRSLLTAETIANELDPSEDLRSVGRRFFSRIELENLWGLLQPDEIRSRVVQIAEILRTGPGILRQLLSDLAANRFVLQIRSTESAETRRHANNRARLITVAVLTVALALLSVGSTGIMLTDRFPLSYVFWVLLVGVVLWLSSLWRRL